MTMPLMVLAACTVIGCVILTPLWPWLHSFLDGKAVHAGHLHYAGVATAFVLVAVGIGLGVFIYRGAGAEDPLEQKAPGVFRLLANKLWIDELYAATVLAWTRAAARFSDWMERHIWDGAARFVAGVGKAFSFLSTAFDEQGINPLTRLGGDLTQDLGAQGSRLHVGRIQIYLGVIAGSMLVFLLVYVWLT
jgi:NADH-quinone oxidoreductase subunit L